MMFHPLLKCPSLNLLLHLLRLRLCLCLVLRRRPRLFPPIFPHPPIYPMKPMYDVPYVKVKHNLTLFSSIAPLILSPIHIFKASVFLPRTGVLSFVPTVALPTIQLRCSNIFNAIRHTALVPSTSLYICTKKHLSTVTSLNNCPLLPPVFRWLWLVFPMSLDMHALTVHQDLSLNVR